MKSFNKNLRRPKAPSVSRGFVALFTVLIAAVILSMAVGISTIALKQIVLSASATDANKSFYAADTGIECALYHDIKVPPPNSFDQGFTTNIYCGGFSTDAAELSSGYFVGFDFLPIPGFQIRVGPNQEYCAYVIVDKATVPGQTIITSKGLNAPCGSPSNARVVERAIEVRY